MTKKTIKTTIRSLFLSLSAVVFILFTGCGGKDLKMLSGDSQTSNLGVGAGALGLENPAGEACKETNRKALIALYDATSGDNWANKTNWKTEKPLNDWYGVSTNAEDCVVTLELGNNQLTGFIPSELGKLTASTRLYLGSNRLTGSIPSELGKLKALRILWLSSNDLSGSIPSEFGNLTALGSLLLSNNQLSGSIPSALGNLSKLETLQLGDNDLSGSIPSELGKLTKLTHLYLENNKLSGSIPSELGKLTKLTVLYLHNNRSLTGSLLGNWCDIADLHISNTGLSCVVETCKETDRKALIALYDATSGDNWKNKTNWKTEKPLNDWHGVSTNTEGCVENLYLYGNQLSGSIPSELGKLKALKYLFLTDNQLSGSIPSELGLTSLVILRLSNNQLSGSIPSALGKLTTLGYLWLHNNPSLTGPLPGNWCDIADLRISNTGLSSCP